MRTSTSRAVDVVEQLRTLVRGDGADLRLVTVDDRANIIELALQLGDANCADCVLPPERLHEVLAASLAQRGVTSHRLVLHDPRRHRHVVHRRASPGARSRPHSSKCQTATRARCGLARRPYGRLPRGRAVAVLGLGRRRVDEVAQLGRRARCVRGDGPRASPATKGRRRIDAYQQFIEGVDAAIVGLGNCGSCTSWTIKDAIAAVTL